MLGWLGGGSVNKIERGRWSLISAESWTSGRSSGGSAQQRSLTGLMAVAYAIYPRRKLDWFYSGPPPLIADHDSASNSEPAGVARMFAVCDFATYVRPRRKMTRGEYHLTY
jgi:hypothetical protein